MQETKKRLVKARPMSPHHFRYWLKDFFHTHHYGEQRKLIEGAGMPYDLFKKLTRQSRHSPDSMRGIKPLFRMIRALGWKVSLQVHVQHPSTAKPRESRPMGHSLYKD